MKKILLFLILLTDLLCKSYSTTFLQDSFLNDGSLNGKTPLIGQIWTNSAGTLNEMQVIGSKVRLVGGNSEDVHSLFPWGGGGSLFIGFTVHASNAPNAGTSDYIGSFRSGGFFNGRIFYLRPNGSPPDTFRIGIATNGNTANIEWPNDLPINTDFRVVVRITENSTNDHVTLWIDPTNIADPSVTTETNSFFSTVSGFILRQGNNLTGQLDIDDIIVTDNFMEAAIVNTPPTTEGGGIADVNVLENSNPTVINLLTAFQDAETADANLIYSVTATNFVSGDAQIFSGISIDNVADTLTLSYLPNSNGVFNITVRAADAGNLFGENTFQVTVSPPIPPLIITNVIVTPVDGFVFVGQKLALTATGHATNGSSNVTLSATWSSGAPNIAIVDNSGVVTGISPGDANIQSVFEDFTNVVTVKVRKEFLITFSKIKPATRTPKLKTGKGFKLSGKFETGSNTFTKADIISKPIKLQFAFITDTNTNNLIFRDITKITGFKAVKLSNKGKFVVKPVGTDLPASSVTVLLRAFLGAEGVNQESSQIFTNPIPFEVRRK
jgi:hypothetical protein